MILAEKIIQLRKQAVWSQEELAAKMNVSRQSVSKWESANSIPDLNRIILLAKLFDVSTDFLLKDEIEASTPNEESKDSNIAQISLEQASDYLETKIKVSRIITKGVLLCVCSVIPLFFFLAMAQTSRLNITGNIAIALGMIGLIIMISIAVSYFIKLNQYESELDTIDNELFELAYGVHSAFEEKLKKFRPSYNRKLSFGIFLFIISFLPLMITAMFSSGSEMALLMLIVLILSIAVGLYLVIPTSAKFDAYTHLLKDNTQETPKSKRVKRAEKLAAFYWPLLAAIYLGWSLWTMNWGTTWILWPVGAVLFAALLGLMELLEKDES